jgi:hypothetical protein
MIYCGVQFPTMYIREAQELTLNGIPPITLVLPQNEEAMFIERIHTHIDSNDCMYLVHVLSSGYADFIGWARNIPKERIIVGGPHPSVIPTDFIQWAHKIVVGPCDDIINTIKQEGQIVQGKLTFENLPRYDVLKKYKFTNYTLTTSFGCYNDCGFCIVPLVSQRKVISKPQSVLRDEARLFKNVFGKVDYIFLTDPNFTFRENWKQTLDTLNDVDIADGYTVACSMNAIVMSDLNDLQQGRVSILDIGVENPMHSYSKNIDSFTDKVIQEIGKMNDMGFRFCFFEEPLRLLDSNYLEKFKSTMKHRLEECKPVKVCGRFLVPIPGTPSYEEHKHQLVSEYSTFTFRSFYYPDIWVKDPKVAEMLSQEMFGIVYEYYKSDTYKKIIEKFTNTRVAPHLVHLKDKYDVRDIIRSM